MVQMQWTDLKRVWPEDGKLIAVDDVVSERLYAGHVIGVINLVGDTLPDEYITLTEGRHYWVALPATLPKRSGR